MFEFAAIKSIDWGGGEGEQKKHDTRCGPDNFFVVQDHLNARYSKPKMSKNVKTHTRCVKYCKINSFELGPNVHPPQGT